MSKNKGNHKLPHQPGTKIRSYVNNKCSGSYVEGDIEDFIKIGIDLERRGRKLVKVQIRTGDSTIVEVVYK